MDKNDDPFSRELREQTDELIAIRRALEAERQRYLELFEAAPVAYLVTDPMARVCEANRAAAALFGVAQGFLAGKPLAAYVDGTDRWGFRVDGEPAVPRRGPAGGRLAAAAPVPRRRGRHGDRHRRAGARPRRRAGRAALAAARAGGGTAPPSRPSRSSRR